MLDLNLFPRSNAESVLEALNRSLGIIEFSPDGEVLSANENSAMSWATAFQKSKAGMTVYSSSLIMRVVPNIKHSGRS